MNKLLLPLAALLVWPLSAPAQTYSFTTVAGGLYADGVGGDALFASPLDIAIGPDGNLFVVDAGNLVIRKITPDGVVSTLAGVAREAGSDDGPGAFARFTSPRGITVDRGGNAYVADNATIRRIAPDGRVTTVAGRPGEPGSADGKGTTAARFGSYRYGYLIGMEGLAVDGDGNVYVADTGNSTIRKLTPDGAVTTIAGRARENGATADQPWGVPIDGDRDTARFYEPTSLAVDAAGNVFVAEGVDDYWFTAYTAVRKISPSGEVTTLIKSKTAGQVDILPLSIAVDAAGSVYVLDESGFLLKRSAGDRWTLVSSDTTSAFSGSIAADPGGNVFFTDTGNRMVRRVGTDGVVTTLAGVEGGNGSADGMGTNARFANPTGIAVDRRGSVFVAETFNNTIRKITADGAVTTLAGLAGSYGSNDGTGSAARFANPQGVAVDSSGTVFVADTDSHTIRKITADGVVTTLAGTAITAGPARFGGSADGPVAAARFKSPSGVAVDTHGNVIVADTGNHTIRKISADGVVTTLAGSAGVAGSNNGRGNLARFNEPSGVAIDGNGNIFVADTSNLAVRKINADGDVTTLAGNVGQSPRGVAVDGNGNVFVTLVGSDTIRKIASNGVATDLAGQNYNFGFVDGAGSAARFNKPSGIAVDDNGIVFVADARNNAIRIGVPAAIPTAAVAPQSQHIEVGARATFTVTAAGTGLGFQWKKDGVTIAGATRGTYQIASASVGDTGFYSAVATSAAGSVESPVAILTVATSGTSRLVNFSIRNVVPAGGDLTAGFVIRGGGEKSVLVRAIGPTLGNFGAAGTLIDPRLDVFSAGASTAVSSSDDWGGGPALAAAFASVGAFPLSATAKDAALLGMFAPGGYSARVTSRLASDSGVVLTEVYDRESDGAASRLVNISSLGAVDPGAQAYALGFVIGGTAPKQLLIRAIGPGLAPLGVINVLSDPQLSVIPAGKILAVASNDNWGGDAALASAVASAGAFVLPASSKDAALAVRLPPGAYTVMVSGVPYTSGRALVEIYDLDP
jgi:streptogramin lyase